MPESVDFGAFAPDGRIQAIAQATAQGKIVECGWIAPQRRTTEMHRIHSGILAGMPRFQVIGRFTAAERRYPLWKAGVLLTGKPIRYIQQVTGSCVGAGGGNALKTLMAVEIALGNQPKEYREPWWPYTYGRSRLLSGIKGTGDGSLGSGWAKAIAQDGMFDATAEFPQFKEDRGWISLSSKIEMEWSDGAKLPARHLERGRKHLVKSVSQMRSPDDVAQSIANGYPCTIASSFGMKEMVPRPQGDPPVRVGTWTGTWQHQMSIDEWWDHPTLKSVFRINNQWGPDAHGTPTGEEPPGGFYVTAATLGKILSSRDTECYALSSYDGFPARELNFSAF